MELAKQKCSRDGCWTCRRRRKKCESNTFPCQSCDRLGLQCERKIRLVWEDDMRRAGMKRRGPPTSAATTSNAHDATLAITAKPICSADVETVSLRTRLWELSGWPFDLDATDSLLLNRYIQRFSRTYPAFSDPKNPFLSVLIPLSTQNRVVLDCLLALSAVQSWENECFTMQCAMLRLREKALHGCRRLLVEHYNKREDIIYLLASCVLLLLYEKLAGEGQHNWTPHLQFFSRILRMHLFPAILSDQKTNRIDYSRKDAIRFLASLFLYNDLVRSTSMQTPTLSDFYLGNNDFEYLQPSFQEDDIDFDRFVFPRLIARISAADLTVTDAEIAAWSGGLHWVPSFALHPLRCTNTLAQAEGTNEQWTVSELYRIAAMIYRRQSLQSLPPEAQSADDLPSIDDIFTKSLPLRAIELLNQLPDGSIYETSLLWPIGIVARVLTGSSTVERACITAKLQTLELRFQLRHFGLVRKHLVAYWRSRDQAYPRKENDCILFG